MENKEFVKLRPWDAGLVRLVVHGLVDLPKGQAYSRPSLSSAPGFKALMDLRNDAISKEQATPEESCLFDAPTATHKKKRLYSNMNAAKLSELRLRPTVFEFECSWSAGCTQLAHFGHPAGTSL